MSQRIALLLGVAALLLAACGGGGAEPTPTPTTTRTPRPTATWTPAPAEAGTPVDAALEPRCPDPYPNGAPYEPAPGEPIRLQPIGSAQPPLAYAPIALDVDDGLEDLLLDAIEGEEEHIAIVVKDLESGRGVAIAPARSFYAASLYKVWVMLEAYHQRDAGLLDFAEPYIVSDHYLQFGLNPGELPACEEVTVGEAMGRMLAYSDNVAANLVLDRVGAGNVNAALRGLGLTVSEAAEDGSLPTTAGDMALLLESIARGSALSESTSGEMHNALYQEGIDDRIPALLPEEASVAHKTGSWENATHDAAIVETPGATYVLVVLTDYGYADGGAGRIALISRGVYSFFNPP